MTTRRFDTDASHIARSTSGASQGVAFTSAKSDSRSNITKNRTVVVQTRTTIIKPYGIGKFLDSPASGHPSRTPTVPPCASDH